MINTMRFMTDANGDEIELVAYTAFGGERGGLVDSRLTPG
jgi:hypothetical protein